MLPWVMLLNFNVLLENPKKLSIHSKDQNTITKAVLKFDCCRETFETTRGYQNSQDFSIQNKKFLRFCDSIFAIKCHQLELWSRCMHACMFVDGENVFLPNRSGILCAYAMRMTCEELKMQFLCKF